MGLYSISQDLDLDQPTLVVGLAGWGDAASAASDAADRLAEDGTTVVSFTPDELFDYRSNRPVLRISGGESVSLTWPRLEIVHVIVGGRDVLVMVGNEPDYRWKQLSSDLGGIVQELGVTRLVTLGAVPAPVRHASTTAAFCTTSDPRLLLPGDEMLMDEIVVPASAVTVLRIAVEEAGVPGIGYWAQVPQYVGRSYSPAVVALLEKARDQLGVELELGDLRDQAAEQVHRLDEILEQRADAREFVEQLDLSVGTTSKVPENLPTADEIAEEISRFLEETGEDG